MLWANCKDYAKSTSNKSDIFKCTRSGMVFWLGNFFFFPFWQITCIVDVNSISNEKCQNNQGEKQNLGVPT